MKKKVNIQRSLFQKSPLCESQYLIDLILKYLISLRSTKNLEQKKKHCRKIKFYDSEQKIKDDLKKEIQDIAKKRKPLQIIE